MAPVLEERAGLLVRGVVEPRDVVGAEPAEERQVVRAREHVHRVDLEDTEPVDRAEQRGRRDARRTRRSRRREPLRGERDPPRLARRQILEDAGYAHQRPLFP